MNTEALLDRLEKHLNAIGDTVSTAEFQAAVGEIVQFVQAIEKRTLQDVGIIADTFEKGLAKLQTDHGTSLTDLKGQVGSAVEQMQGEHGERMRAVDGFQGEHQARITSVDRMIEEARAAVAALKPEKGEKGDDGNTDTPAEIVDKLESLEGDDRLDVSAIKGIDELEKLIIRQSSGPGGVIAIQRGAIKLYDLSDQLNGVLKTFALPAFWRVTDVQSTSGPTAFRPGIDYTVDGAAMTITFTSEINAAATLAQGQTLLIQYAEA